MAVPYSIPYAYTAGVLKATMTDIFRVVSRVIIQTMNGSLKGDPPVKQ
tara:strand:+ start:14209 stop:14352 length:144 start_codon:yes stop_codon:yes gene_type:complete